MCGHAPRTAAFLCKQRRHAVRFTGREGGAVGWGSAASASEFQCWEVCEAAGGALGGRLYSPEPFIMAHSPP